MIVIYDGECDLCQNAVTWLQKRLSVTALAYQHIDLGIYQLTERECAAAVQLILPDRHLSGAGAVAYLLRQTRWRALGSLIDASGPLGRHAYRHLALHRTSLLAKWLNWIIKFS
jgi:predicted DCC family thiol-disulfide oxidoreductase YuxK